MADRRISQVLAESEFLNETPTVKVSQILAESEFLNETPTVKVSQILAEVEIDTSVRQLATRRALLGVGV